MAEPVPESGPLTMAQAYLVLELAETDMGALDKVKAAYRKLCLRWHPDKNPPEQQVEATARFTRITAAYHTITTNNFDFARWARSYVVPPMQGLEDVLKMALSGRDPFEIEAMLRARGDYRPHGNFGVDLAVPWTAGEKHDPSFDVQNGSAYRTTEAIGDTRKRMELMWQEEKVAGSSDDRPWERVGGFGFESSSARAPLALENSKPEGLRPDLEPDSPEAAGVAEALNDRGMEAFGAKKFPLAYALYSECVRLQPDKAPYRGNRAAAGLKIPGKEKAVVADCEKAVELQPDFVRGYVRMGQALLALGDRGDTGDVALLKRAERALARAMELEPGNKTAKKTWKEVGISLQLHGDSESDSD
eukprot:CAMPEP_0181395228 /NCGR_PEP_ID=MMETSP1106-20121128/28224_1 /TAXON_ID=81844 /ORGANISM="Mantoniella antarctica, Strain SL-175" /LENGTH=360 /DNA_ID=CAMNT_0023516827 /DNA_START=115 /DNA_END=1197 /DNA_ORIENTATION=-